MAHLRSRNQKAQLMVGRAEHEQEHGVEGHGRRLTEIIDPADPAFRHICHAATSLSQFGFDITDPGMLARIVEVGRRRYAESQRLDRLHAERTAVRDQALAVASTSSVVYYMRIGNRVKIGYTTNLASRLSTINPEELLVVEPGNRLKEIERHRQFSHLRVHGEWFRLEGSLAIHIAGLQHASQQN